MQSQSFRHASTRRRAIRLIFSAVAVLALLLPQAASAATSSVTVTPGNLAGWSINADPCCTTPFSFVAGPATSGVGSVQFGPITADNKLNKFILGRAESIPTADLDGISYDFYIDPGASNQDFKQFYLNVYVNGLDADPNDFYDCRYDYVPTAGVTGWNTLSIDATTSATTVTVRGPSAAQCGVAIADGIGGTVTIVVLNGGDTGLNDTGIQGGFDTVTIAAGGDAVTYDFEPDTDGDGVADGDDNCPADANADQADVDSDGIGDACDNDNNNDGIPDTAPPANKDECKNGGWATFNNPSFDNQGDCVNSVVSNA